jgi:uncharacterized protein (DUF983 family)
MASISNVLKARGGHGAAYRMGKTNQCPGCGRSHWYVGRTLAECAFCETAMPLESNRAAAGQIVRTIRRRPALDSGQIETVA